MRRELFLHLVDSVCTTDLWFIQKRDDVRRLALSSLQKCTVALKMFSFGLPANAYDEYVCIDETNILVAIRHWVNVIWVVLEIGTCSNPHLLICNAMLRIIDDVDF